MYYVFYIGSTNEKNNTFSKAESFVVEARIKLHRKQTLHIADLIQRNQVQGRGA